MEQVKRTVKMLLWLTVVVASVAAVFHLCGVWMSGCSPVNVQIQNCQNEIRDAQGITFTGCKSDGEGKSEGTLRVNLDKSEDNPGESSTYQPNTARWAARLN